MSAENSGTSDNVNPNDLQKNSEKLKKQEEADRRLDKELSDTFPASDVPSVTQPGGGQEQGAEDVER